MKNLIVVGHPNKDSFCTSGIARTIKETLEQNNQDVYVIDLYAENKTFEFHKDKVKEYKELVTWADSIYFVSPVYWFRCSPAMETFFDQIFTPGFAYKFKPITKKYGVPIPLLKDKKVRLVMGVYSFVFGWFRTKTRQFWSVPFVSQNDRMVYLEKVKMDVVSDLRK